MKAWDMREGWYALLAAILSPKEISADEIFIRFFGINLFTDR